MRRREKKKRNRLGRREKLAQKSREEGEIGSESREKGDLPPCPPPFLWNGKDKVIRSSTFAPYEQGGLRMIDYETMIKALRLSWLKHS